MNLFIIMFLALRILANPSLGDIPDYGADETSSSQEDDLEFQDIEELLTDEELDEDTDEWKAFLQRLSQPGFFARDSRGPDDQSMQRPHSI